jgi:hypothetical protein
MTKPIRNETIIARLKKHHNSRGFSYHSRWNEDSRKDINHEKKKRGPQRRHKRTAEIRGRK